MIKTLTQKDISATLENAAARADIIDLTAATDKQCWFLASLIDEETYNEALDSNYILTKSEASKLIEKFKNEPAEKKAIGTTYEVKEKVRSARDKNGKRERMTW